MFEKLFLGLAGILAIGRVQAADVITPVVVELFTSQGCSSCPPADAVLSKLADRPDVLALSFHVDYWDSLGWRDPFASPLNTARQKAYRVAFGNAQIYTPQMVIGGMSEMPGQNARSVSAAIDNVGKRRSSGPELRIDRVGKLPLTVTAMAAGNAPTATVWVAAYAPHQQTAVRRGENAGASLVNTNVVRKLLALGAYRGSALTLTLPVDFARGEEGIAAWIQVDPSGVILSAANAPPL